MHSGSESNIDSLNNSSRVSSFIFNWKNLESGFRTGLYWGRSGGYVIVKLSKSIVEKVYKVMGNA